MNIKNPPNEIDCGVGGLNLTPCLVNPLVNYLQNIPSYKITCHFHDEPLIRMLNLWA